MNPIFAYLIKSSVSLAILYCLFRFVMRNDRNHTINRFLLLGILFVSAIIPFLNIQLFYEEVQLAPVEFVREFVSSPVPAEPAFLTETIQPVIQSKIIEINYWLLFYSIIILLLIFRLLFGILQVSKIIKKAEKKRLRKIVLAVVKDFIQPFTFLNKIVLSEQDFNENKDIVVAHEHAHIKYMHALDLMVCELFTVMQFFNPFMWLLRRDLKLIHEYQADEAVLKKGIDAQKYQLLVLEKAVGNKRFAMANHFTQKPILKRLNMMMKTKHRRWGGVKLILFVPLIILLLQAFARPELITSADELIPVKYTENKAEEWLSKWTSEKIGKGFFQPGMKSEDAPKTDNNVLVILMNAKNKYLVEGELAEGSEIKSIVTNYLHGENPDGKTGPDYGEKEIPGVGKVKVSKGLISFKHDIVSSKEAVNNTIRQIGEACLEMRQKKAQVFFGKDYFELEEEKQEAVDLAAPVWFAYEYPKAPPASVWLPFDAKPSPEPKPMELLVKYDGTMFLENVEYENLEEFQEVLKSWKKELEERGKELKTKPYYRVNVTFEHGSETEQICSEDIRKIEYVLWKESMHMEKINHVFPEEEVRRPLQLDKLKKRNEEVENKVEDLREAAVQKDTTLSPPPQVLEVLPSNQQYNIPTIRFHEKWINMNGERYELDELTVALEDLLPNDGTQRQIELTVYSTVSKERVEEIYAALQNVDDFEIIRKDVTPPPPPPMNPITLKRDGYISLNNELMTIEQLQTFLVSMEARHRMNSNKNDNENYRLLASVKVEDGASQADIERLKTVMKMGNFKQVNYSTIYPENPKKLPITVSKNIIKIDGKTCTVEGLDKTVRTLLTKDENIRTIHLTFYEHSSLSKELVEEVQKQLSNIKGVNLKVNATNTTK